MKRITTSMLALLLLLASCNSGTTETTNNVDSTNAEQVVEETYVETKPLVEELYGDRNYDGKTFRIYTMDIGGHFYANVGSNFHELCAEEITGEILNDAIYERNVQTEQLLNITVQTIHDGGDSNVQSGLTAAVASGSDDFDAVFNGMAYLADAFASGALYNLNNIDTMDTSHSWWDKQLVDCFTLFNSQLYWISGDFNIFDDYAAEAIFFNKKLCDDNGLAYPYDAVREGTWTIEQFYQMAKTVEKDANGDGILSTGTDVVGHLEPNDHLKHWIYAMGEKSIDLNDNGSLAVYTTTERHINAVNKLFDLMVVGGMTHTADADIFCEDGALFFGTMIGVINALRDMESDYGVVPMPKYDEAQENYGGYVSNGWVTVMVVPVICRDFDFTGVCMEVLSAYSTNTVRRAALDVMLTNKTVRDAEAVEMIEIVFTNKIFDWAVDFSWGGSFGGLYNDLWNSKTNNFVSSATGKLQAQTAELEKLLSNISNFAE